MTTINQFVCTVSIAVLTGTLAVPTFGQDVDVQADRTTTQVRPDGDKVDVDGSDSPVASTSTISGTTAGESLNAQIASWAAIDQRSIVNLAEMGGGRTQTPAVKELASTISREHQKLAERLAAFAAPRAAEASFRAESDRREAIRENEAAAREARRDAVRDRDEDRTPLENFGDRIGDRVEGLADRAERAADATRDAIDRSTMSEEEFRSYRLNRSPWLEIHREITAELDSTARRELEQYRGYELDASFIGMVIAAHLQQEASLKTLSQHASGDLAQTLKTALSEVRQHREKAESVMNAITPRR